MWVMAGDFNDIINNSEKSGGRIREVSSFQNLIFFFGVGGWVGGGDLGAIDLGFNGKLGLGGALLKMMV